MRILALDIGSTCRLATKTFATLLTTDVGTVERTSVPTTPAGLLGLIGAQRPDRVVLEQTSSTGWVVDLCRAANVAEVQVLNPKDEAWRNRVSKTDRNDADLLAKLSATGQGRTVHVPEPRVRQWRALIDLRHEVVRQRTRAKNHIKAILRTQGLASGAGMWTKAGFTYLAEMARPLASCDAANLWRGALRLRLDQLAELTCHLDAITERLDRLVEACPMAGVLTDLPGIGPRAAEQVAATLDDPRRFANRRQVGAYIGAVPRVSQSGSSRHHGRITKSGDSLARALLTQIVHAAIPRKANWIAAIYHQHRRNDATRGMRAVQATVRRIMVIMWAKCRDHRRTHPDETLLPAAA